VRKFLHDHINPGVFAPDAVSTLIAAFDGAWQYIVASGVLQKSYTLRSLVRSSAKHDAEVTVDHARRVFSRALKKLDSSQGHNPTLRAMTTLLK